MSDTREGGEGDVDTFHIVAPNTMCAADVLAVVKEIKTAYPKAEVIVDMGAVTSEKSKTAKE